MISKSLKADHCFQIILKSKYLSDLTSGLENPALYFLCLLKNLTFGSYEMQ